MAGAALREAAGQPCLVLGSGLHRDLSTCLHILFELTFIGVMFFSRQIFDAQEAKLYKHI